MAPIAAAHACASGGITRTLRMRARCPASAIATCPVTEVSPTSAAIVTGPSVAGRTRPTAPRRRAASSSAAVKSPSDSVRPTRTRLPSACPASSPDSNRCSKASGHGPGDAASATRHRRRSPGAATSRSRRRRPDDPPSSATLTTAVMSPAYLRMARSATESPCPPPSATTRGPDRSLVSGTRNVPVVHRRRIPVSSETLRELVGDDDAPVPASGTTDADREIRLPLVFVARERELEQPVELVEEVARLRLAQHVVAHTPVFARQRTQLVDPVRIREKAAVEHEVDVERQSVLVTERDDVHLQPRLGLIG